MFGQTGSVIESDGTEVSFVLQRATNEFITPVNGGTKGGIAGSMIAFTALENRYIVQIFGWIR